MLFVGLAKWLESYDRDKIEIDGSLFIAVRDNCQRPQNKLGGVIYSFVSMIKTML